MLVGLCGKKRSGKDTAGLYLVETYGFERHAFADPMKEAVYALDPMIRIGRGHMNLQTVVDELGWDTVKQMPEVRRLLQRFGTEMGRTLWGEDFWVDRAFARVDLGADTVFTDVRFDNEDAAIRRRGGITIQIERPDTDTDDDAHASEVIDFTPRYIVVNDGSIEDLHRKLDALYKEHIL